MPEIINRTPSDGEGLASSAEAQRILEWLKTRSLHFGQSAFIALEEMLRSSGIPSPFQGEGWGEGSLRVDLAAKLILIDILTGIITPLDNKQYNPEADDELKISLYAMKKAAKVYGLDTIALRMTFEELLKHHQAACPNSEAPCSFRMLVFFNEHYVIVTKVTQDGITYIDTAAGIDGTEEIVTVSRDEFIQVWKGVALTSRAPPESEAQVLTQADTQKVRGAACFDPISCIVFAFIVIAHAIWAAVTAVVGAVVGLIGSIISGIGSILSGIVQGLGAIFAGNFAAGFSSIFHGFALAFTGIHGALLGGFLGIVGALPFIGGPLAGFLAGSSVFNFIFTGAFLSVASFGIAKGLELVGLPPLAAALITGFLTGGIIGFINPIAGLGALESALAGGLSSVAIQGLGALGQVLNLPPLLTTGIQLVGQLAAGFAVGGATGLGSWEALKQVAPKALGAFASSGVALLGEKIGLPWRLSTLIGMPIRSTLAGLMNGVQSGIGIFDSIKGALQAGAKSIGFDFGGALTHPLFGFLGSNTILQSIESTLGRGGLFSSIFNLLGKALLSPFNAVEGLVRGILNGSQNFLDLIQQKGVAGAFESLATSIFSRKTIENLLGQGRVGGVISTAAKVLTTFDGQTVQEQKLSNTTSLFYDLTGGFIGKREDGITQIGTFGVNPFGKWALIAGRVVATILGDIVFAGDVENGQLKRMTVSDSSGVILEGNPEGDGPIVIEGPGEPGSNSQGSFWNAVFKLLPLALGLFFYGGNLGKVDATLSVPSDNSVSTEPIDVALLNGFWPSLSGIPNGTILEYYRPDNPFQEKLNQLGITDSRIKEVSLFERGIIGDIIDWLFSLRDAEEIIAEFRKIQETQPNHPFVPVANSGGAEPLIRALSDPRYEGFGIETAILVGGPVRDEFTEFSTTSLERIINVYGSEDMFLEKNQSDLVNALTPSIQETFTHTEKSFDTINIEFLGIQHAEYFYSNSDAPTELQRKSSDFIAVLTARALTEADLEDFLLDLKTRGIATFTEETVLDVNTGIQHRVRTYVVDLEGWEG